MCIEKCANIFRCEAIDPPDIAKGSAYDNASVTPHQSLHFAHTYFMDICDCSATYGSCYVISDRMIELCKVIVANEDTWFELLLNYMKFRFVIH